MTGLPLHLGGSPASMLDPAKVAGKIVVCIRGGNVLINKGAAVKTAGGAAMIIQNAPGTNNTTINQPYVIPTVHLDVSAYPTVFAYAQTPGATASFGPGVQQPNVVAPVMADFSSRGPSLANANVLKPDITAPGVDIIAAWVDNSLTQAQHDALVLNSFTPAANANSIQGTSMSSPHVAGSAALLKQLHPTWSPAMIKSALMTTTNGVKLANGTPDPNRFGYGAGHLNPNPAGDPGLVYDITTADYGRFLCGLNLTPPAGAGTCASLGSIQPYNLNLASLTAASVVGTVTLNRKVTNVTGATSTYVATATLPGWNAVVSPASLTIAPGATASYAVALTRTSAALNTWTFGSLVWNDGVHTVTSPLSVNAAGFIAPAEVSDVRAGGRGSKVYNIISAYTGSMGVSATGLVPATRTSNVVQGGATQCVNTVIPAGQNSRASSSSMPIPRAAARPTPTSTCSTARTAQVPRWAAAAERLPTRSSRSSDRLPASIRRVSPGSPCRRAELPTRSRAGSSVRRSGRRRSRPAGRRRSTRRARRRSCSAGTCPQGRAIWATLATPTRRARRSGRRSCSSTTIDDLVARGRAAFERLFFWPDRIVSHAIAAGSCQTAGAA